MLKQQGGGTELHYGIWIQKAGEAAICDQTATLANSIASLDEQLDTTIALWTESDTSVDHEDPVVPDVPDTSVDHEDPVVPDVPDTPDIPEE